MEEDATVTARSSQEEKKPHCVVFKGGFKPHNGANGLNVMRTARRGALGEELSSSTVALMNLSVFYLEKIN